ncbi:hypothetical protein HMPREF9436_00610 [Faecalibacterium cf. prausnitzii KLE1255]|uniref:Uncharacterized protein n=1 Tax=Faecalibacterium cf. prausnitzii KLE1255 TaxID=748224 RepID=E2ZG26_9FIRM|nr:hypothetical protein HMPREF9436_00610 [Faecalibacterium cf. prausnitzii KLE1255]
MGIQLLLHKTIKHFLREQRLLVAKGFADEDQGHYGLTTGVQPEGIQGVQRLLGGLVQGEMQQKAAVLFPAALVHELVGVPVLVQPVEALVQRQVGAELRKTGGTVLAAAGILAPGQKKNDHAKYGGKQDNGNCGVHEDPPEEFFLL